METGIVNLLIVLTCCRCQLCDFGQFTCYLYQSTINDCLLLIYCVPGNGLGTEDMAKPKIAGVSMLMRETNLPN